MKRKPKPGRRLDFAWLESDHVYMSTGVVSVRLPNDLKERLDRLAEATGRPAAFYVREALSEHLDDIEWAYGVAAVAEEVRVGSLATRPIDALLEDLGMSRDQLSTSTTEA